jgi:hypothetical protein
MVDGSIRAEDVRSALVRLTTTTGEIVLVGLLQPAAHYDLRSYTGDVRVVPGIDRVGFRGSARFELRARSSQPIDATGFTMRTLWQRGDRLHAEVMMNKRTGTAAQASPLVELSSVFGRIMIQPWAEGPRLR